MRAAELAVELAVLKESLSNARQESAALAERLKTAENAAKDLATRLNTLQTRFDEQIKQSDKWDNRRWAMIGLFVASLLSLVANLIVIALRTPTK